MVNPTTMLFTKVFAVTSSAFLCGYSFSASHLTMPALTLAPLPVALSQWQLVFSKGAFVSPPLSVLGGAAWMYLAYAARNNPRQSPALLAVAGLATFAVLGWTALTILGTNQELMKRWKQVREGETMGKAWEGETRALLRKWDGLNWVRPGLPMVGCFVGLYALLL